MSRYRCPYCHSDLPPPAEWKNSRCPKCRRTILVAGGIADRKAKADARREALDKIARDAERVRKTIHQPPFSKTPAGFLVIGAFVLLITGSVLVTRAKQRDPTQKRADQIATAQRELHVLSTAVGLFRIHTDHLPRVSEGGIWALIDDPGTDGWRGPYITSDPIDPWGEPYQYDFTIEPPTLRSKGPDRILETDDDILADPASLTPDPKILDSWRPESASRKPASLIFPHPTLP